jgi:hypothetical protein
MLHVGSRAYYAEIRKRLVACDSILIEGVRSPRATFLTLAYRVLAKVRRLDLVTQESLELWALRAKLVGTDISGEEFDTGWHALPLWTRLLNYIAVPCYALYLILFGTRALIAQYAEFNDLPSREEVLASGMGVDELDDLLVKQRDERLLQWIAAFEEAGGTPGTVVGVLYGAAHMRAVTRYLLGQRRYHVAEAEWVTVFTF